MVGGANRFHDSKQDQARAAGPRTLEGGPVLPLAVRGVILGALALLLIGMGIETVADVSDLADTGSANMDHFVAGALKAYALFAIGVAFLWGASESRQLSTGARVGLLVMGTILVLNGSSDGFVDVGAFFGGSFGGFPFS